jgi:hypothetical protein
MSKKNKIKPLKQPVVRRSIYATFDKRDGRIFAIFADQSDAIRHGRQMIGDCSDVKELFDEVLDKYFA